MARILAQRQRAFGVRDSHERLRFRCARPCLLECASIRDAYDDIHAAPHLLPRSARSAFVHVIGMPAAGSAWKARLTEWFFEGIQETVGPFARPTHTTAWWKVMCLTGVDYFSTLGYQPSIAFLAAGFLSPLATLVLVLLTLCGALPVYSRVAKLSPHGQGSIMILEDVFPRWRGKAFVLCLLGFAATDFVITMTLSAADATAHLVENPFVGAWATHRVGVTLMLLAALGAVFLKGFREAIGLAVLIVALYLSLNIAVVGWGLAYIWTHPDTLVNWRAGLFAQQSNPVLMVGLAVLLFPKLALGLSGFETGVAVMPLVRGDEGEAEKSPFGRIRNTQKLLYSAAGIMSVMLLTSSVVTTVLIPPAAFNPGGPANGRALAYLAHEHFGPQFGTLYDFCTIAILWFAGASAMAGLLNLVPRYLPRYGMAPEWARATRPLVVLITAITFFVTIQFRADVDAQGGAYATGVLVLMTSAALAVTSISWREQHGGRTLFLLITVVFIYTTIANIIERPEGIKIASVFIVTIVATSLISRVLRSTELRVQGLQCDVPATRFIEEVSNTPVRLIANRPDSGERDEYAGKLAEARDSHHLPLEAPVLFLEVFLSDASDFSQVLRVRGVSVGEFRVLRCESPAVPNAIAAMLLDIRDRTGQIPHAYFGWTEGNPVTYLLKFLMFGEGDTAPVTREVLRQVEHDPTRRPRIHVG